MRFCTVATPARLPHARVLARGLAEHHPGARLTALLAGPEGMGGGDEPFDGLAPSEVQARGWRGLLEEDRAPDAIELLRPALVTRLLDEGEGPLVYLEANVHVVAPLQPLERALSRHDVVLAPRVHGALPDDRRRPAPDELAAAGRLGGSLIALGPGGAARELVDWWGERVARAGRTLPPYAAGEPTDHPRSELRMWLELAASRFRSVGTLDDRGSNVSYWNLHERELRSEDGVVTADGRRLRFLHMEGFDPRSPWLLSPRVDRVRVSDEPALAELTESYAGLLLANGWHDSRRSDDVGLLLPDGTPFDDRYSHLLAEAAAAGQEFGDIFASEGLAEFNRWMMGLAPHGAGHGVTRYLYRVYRERPDVIAAYPDLDGSDGEGFAGWAWVFGAHEMEIPERFLPPPPPRIVPAGFERPEPFAVKPPPVPLPRGPKPDASVHVTGLLSGTLGLGEAARAYVRSLQGGGIPVSTSTVDVHDLVAAGPGEADEGYARVHFDEIEAAGKAGFNLVCINAPELSKYASLLGDDGFFGGDGPVIGGWAWETDRIPERWAPAYQLVDEIWVPSKWVAGNLSKVAPVPVFPVPHSLVPLDPGDVELDLGVPDGFQFLFMFDFFSTIQRKNPVGLIDAFRRAFEPGEGPQLVIKTINGVHRHAALEEVLWAARGRPDVHVIDRSLSTPERDALLTGCDCYVSLHRSEGFGLTLAECMLLGKPVVGTAFSATTEFMTEDNSYLVPHGMVRVGADVEIYPPQGMWADPDVEVAAELMRRVVERPDEASAKGERARRDISEWYSPEAVGAHVRGRIEEIRSLWDR